MFLKTISQDANMFQELIKFWLDGMIEEEALNRAEKALMKLLIIIFLGKIKPCLYFQEEGDVFIKYVVPLLQQV